MDKNHIIFKYFLFQKPVKSSKNWKWKAAREHVEWARTVSRRR